MAKITTIGKVVYNRFISLIPCGKNPSLMYIRRMEYICSYREGMKSLEDGPSMGNTLTFLFRDPRRFESHPPFSCCLFHLWAQSSLWLITKWTRKPRINLVIETTSHG